MTGIGISPLGLKRWLTGARCFEPLPPTSPLLLQVGHAVVASCVQLLLPAHMTSVERLSIPPPPPSPGRWAMLWLPPVYSCCCPPT